jgi:hypothetical protein
VLGLESVKDAAGNIIQEAPLAVWANFRQRALDTVICRNQSEDGLECCNPITGTIKTSTGNVGDFYDQGASA